jgi:Na+/H+-dicarboxylate symporter
MRLAISMTFSRQILVGLTAGIALGLLLGEYVAPLGVVADGFVKLLQMTVLPYVMVSIITSLGTLDMNDARRLGLRAGLTLVALWAIALAYTFMFPLVFPAAESASFFSTSLVEKAPPFDFINLYIPSNPFYSLANNIVPAVVLFSVILGVALIGVDRKARLLDVLSVIGAAIARATRFVVRLTPYGIFALSANAAGTLRLEQVQKIQVYLVAYVAISLLVALWVIPGLVVAVTRLRYRDVLGPAKNALITAFIAGDLFIVLPILIESSKRTLASNHVTDEQAAGLPDVIVPASFNFPHTGKLLSLSFVLFAGWFSGTSVPVTAYPELALSGVLTFFGSLNAAVPFLLDLFRIPADTFQLFLATGVINSHFGALLAAVHTVAVALLGSAAITGALRIEVRRVVRYAVTTGVLTLVVVGGLHVLFRTLLRQEFKGRDIVYGMTNLLEHDPTVIVPPGTGDDEPDVPVLASVKRRGILRVGFADGRLPYAFRNGNHQLVGLDVELAHLLAHDLEADVRFVELAPGHVAEGVSAGLADIGIGGNAVTPQLAVETLYSQPYMDETVAFVVKDYVRSRFETWASVRTATDLVIGVPPIPYYQRLMRERLPGLTLRVYNAADNPLADGSGFDAIAAPAERGSVLTLLNPKWTVVVPQPDIMKVPLAFPLARHDQAWADFVNTWIEMKKRDRTIDMLYERWILGRSPEADVPRWSVLRNVLHWVQ